MRIFLVVLTCLIPAASFAEPAPVEEVTVYEDDLSELAGSDLPDTKMVETQAALDKQERPEGLTADGSAPDRAAPKMEKPQMTLDRSKPDVTPDRPILAHWKMTLLLNLAAPDR